MWPAKAGLSNEALNCRSVVAAASRRSNKFAATDRPGKRQTNPDREAKVLCTMYEEWDDTNKFSNRLHKAFESLEDIIRPHVSFAGRSGTFGSQPRREEVSGVTPAIRGLICNNFDNLQIVPIETAIRARSGRCGPPQPIKSIGRKPPDALPKTTIATGAGFEKRHLRAESGHSSQQPLLKTSPGGTRPSGSPGCCKAESLRVSVYWCDFG